MKKLKYEFLLTAGRIINSLEASTIILTGNVHDHFYSQTADSYVPLIRFLKDSMKLRDNMIVTYKITGGIKFQHAEDLEEFSRCWDYWRYGMDDGGFPELCKQTAGKPSYALELLKQMSVCASEMNETPAAKFSKKLLIMIEGIDSVIPANGATNLSEAERVRIQICMDWFKDPRFIESQNAAILVCESKSQVNDKVARLPHVMELQIDSPTEAQREHFVEWFEGLDRDHRLSPRTMVRRLPELSAGLSILALRRLLRNAVHKGGKIREADLIEEVKNYIERELGDIVKFKVPGHTLKDVVGCSQIKSFVNKKVVPRFKSTGKDSLPGVAVSGSIGVGKTFFWEAIAAESGMIVLVLGSLRNKWFGESDLRLERLRRILYAFMNVLIFIDEADAQFTSLSSGEQHPTEKRLQAGILGMMSDPKLRGKVKWLLLTARIDKLSHDMLRPGRPGSLIIPMLDPQGKDREDFLRWSVEAVTTNPLTKDQLQELLEFTDGYFPAMFAELRSELQAESRGRKMSLAAVKRVMEDIISPAVADTRRYQELCAKIYCNRRSLLPEGEDREDWLAELQELKAHNAFKPF